jgi:hypothetical protein
MSMYALFADTAGLPDLPSQAEQSQSRTRSDTTGSRVDHCRGEAQCLTDGFAELAEEFGGEMVWEATRPRRIRRRRSR